MPDEQILSGEKVAAVPASNEAQTASVPPVENVVSTPENKSVENIEASPKVEEKKIDPDDEPKYSRRQMVKIINAQVAPKVERAREEARADALNNLTPAELKAIEDKVEEKLNQRQFLEQFNKDRAYILTKLADGTSKYKDFEQVTADLGDVVNIGTARLFSDIDNLEDVIYNLGKDPLKAGQVKMLAMDRDNPNRARLELKKYSDSIKANQAAKSQPILKEPLSQITPSITPMDNGSKSISDLRKLPQYRH